MGSADGILCKIVVGWILISLENVGFRGGDLPKIRDLESERFLIPDFEDNPLTVFESIVDIGVDTTVLDSMVDLGGIFAVVCDVVDSVELNQGNKLIFSLVQGDSSGPFPFSEGVDSVS